MLRLNIYLSYWNEFFCKVAGVKVYPRQTWNFMSHAVSTCISLWCHSLLHAPHRHMHACTACNAPWHLRPTYAVTAWAQLFWIYLYLQVHWVFLVWVQHVAQYCLHWPWAQLFPTACAGDRGQFSISLFLCKQLCSEEASNKSSLLLKLQK